MPARSPPPSERSSPSPLRLPAPEPLSPSPMTPQTPGCFSLSSNSPLSKIPAPRLSPDAAGVFVLPAPETDPSSITVVLNWTPQPTRRLYRLCEVWPSRLVRSALVLQHALEDQPEHIETKGGVLVVELHHLLVGDRADFHVALADGRARPAIVRGEHAHLANESARAENDIELREPHRPLQDQIHGA